jgi:hypothetical protein
MALRKSRIMILPTVLAVSAGCLSLAFASPARAAGTAYYVNCAAASDGNGSLAKPWNNLTTVNGETFAPGDSLLFKRGTTCSGSFVFSSSGTSSSPITIGAYGTGALPAIDGTGQNRAVKLLDTSYVTMQDLEVKNSRVWGVLATTDHDAPAVGITLRNLVVHHVTGGDPPSAQRRPISSATTFAGLRSGSGPVYIPLTVRDWRWDGGCLP